MADPEVVRHLGGPASREETWRKILGSPGLWALLGYGYWVVERREDGAYLGQVGFADFKRDMTPEHREHPRNGLDHGSAGAGAGLCHAKRSLAALAWADEALGGGEIVAIISHENAASIRIAEKAGFSAARRPSTKASRSCCSGGRAADVIPAKAGTSGRAGSVGLPEVPAFAGMTGARPKRKS